MAVCSPIELDVNVAPRKLLCKLRGVGGGIADRIAEHRPFASWDDLAARARLKPKVVVELHDLGASHVAKLRPVHAADSALDQTSAADDDMMRLDADSDEEEVRSSSDNAKEISEQTGWKNKLARWQRHKANFLERFSTDQYFDDEQDRAVADAYYAPLLVQTGGVVEYVALSQLLHQGRRFGGRGKVLFPCLDRHPDGTLRCIYTGRILSDSAGELVLACDEEHCVPQSWQASKTAHTGRDVHHMFAAWKCANGHRGNRPFGEGDVVKTGEWGDTCTVPRGEGEAAFDCKKQQALFLPTMNRGAVARATLYILTAYPGAMDSRRFPRASLDWLVRMASEEPVVLWERHRNAVGHAHQGNRNPFVDHPDWALRLSFSAGFAA